MKNLFTALLLALPLFLMAQFSPTPALEGVVYGATNGQDGGRLVTIDETTGTVTDIGNIQEFGTGDNIQRIVGLAVTATGNMYGVAIGGNFFAGITTSVLLQIDPSTGDAQIIGSPFAPQRGAILDQNGILWSVGYGGSNVDINNIDLNTGTLTDVGDLPVAGWWGPMALNPVNGLIYVYNWSARVLYDFNPSNGVSNAVTSAFDLPGGSGTYPVQVASMFINETGGIFVAGGRWNPNLFQLDLMTSTPTLVGPWSGFAGGGVGPSISALAVNYDVDPASGIPTLSQWGLICLGLIMLVFAIVSMKQRSGIFFRA